MSCSSNEHFIDLPDRPDIGSRPPALCRGFLCCTHLRDIGETILRARGMAANRRLTARSNEVHQIAWKGQADANHALVVSRRLANKIPFNLSEEIDEVRYVKTFCGLEL